MFSRTARLSMDVIWTLTIYVVEVEAKRHGDTLRKA
jgi:hypothetical protein